MYSLNMYSLLFSRFNRYIIHSKFIKSKKLTKLRVCKSLQGKFSYKLSF